MNKTKLMRNLIYIVFSLLILVIGSMMTYYLITPDDVFTEIIKNENQKLLSSNAQIKSFDNLDCPIDDTVFIFDSLLFKFSAAFLMGTMISDNLFLRLGII